MKPKSLKYLELNYNQDGLRLFGDNKFVQGEILIRHKTYLYSILVYILRVFRQKK